jgi:hypothetical protein
MSCHLSIRQRPALPLPSVANKDPRLISVRRSTVVRIGVGLLVLVALGVGTAIGFAVGSKSTPPTKSTGSGTSTTAAHGSTTTHALATTTTTASVPTVLSCGPGSTPHVRPAKLIVGCATGSITVTGITWNAWGVNTGGQGTGTLNEDLTSTPAIVVVFHAVNGIFQDVSITPTKGVSSTPKTTAPTTGSASTTTTTTSGPAPVAASQPGSGWGGD